MSALVEFAIALGNSYPSGRGGYEYNGSFKMVVQNLAYEKQVSIWAQLGSGWKDIPAQYVQSLPGNLELWSAPASNSDGQFVAKYVVLGSTYWDNGNGSDYTLSRIVPDEFSVVPGRNYKVVLGVAKLEGSNLHVDIGVKNIDYHKVVGIVFTTDSWATVRVAHAAYRWTMKSGLEVWEAITLVGPTQEAQLAVFYRVAGAEYWDNNFCRNYMVTPSRSQQWGDVP